MPWPVLETGFSSCPNDTFMFHGLVSGAVSVPFRLSPVLMDIEALNIRAAGDAALPVTKLSASAFAQLTGTYGAPRSGAALGRGCGPLVVSRPEGPSGMRDLNGARVAVPGLRTTATLLLRIFGPPNVQILPMRFERIMPAVVGGEVDAGLIIHESRFTFQDHGLVQVRDLGEAWEDETGLPLPLGIIAVRRDVDPGLADALEVGLRASIEHAFAHPGRSRPWVREHAQEMSDAVCDQHIARYVNRFSVDLGDEGMRALETLIQRGREAGFLPADAPPPWRAL